jgi:hypothetical protein
MTEPTLGALLAFAGADAHATADVPRLAEILAGHRSRFAPALEALDLASVALLPPFDPRWL